MEETEGLRRVSLDRALRNGDLKHREPAWNAALTGDFMENLANVGCCYIGERFGVLVVRRMVQPQNTPLEQLTKSSPHWLGPMNG